MRQPGVYTGTGVWLFRNNLAHRAAWRSSAFASFSKISALAGSFSASASARYNAIPSCSSRKLLAYRLRSSLVGFTQTTVSNGHLAMGRSDEQMLSDKLLQ